MAYTNIDDPSAYFQTALYAGNNTTDHNITNDGNSDLQPDLVWIKQRTSDNPHVLQDTSRGFAGNGEANVLQSNSTAAEVTNGAFESFNTNGFGVGGTNVASGAYNLSGSNYVAWQWKANGGTTSTNTDGDINSTVQVNSDAGFSIVTWSATNTTARSIGHGLGVQPQVVIVRNRPRLENWRVFHRSAGITGSLKLDDATAYNSSTTLFTGDSTSTVFKVGTDFSVNGNYAYVAYCFANVQGYSKFGKYEGNSNANGPFIYTGFKPAFIMIKPADISEHWVMHDSKRDEYNGAGTPYVFANEAEAETASYERLDFLSNGFKIRVGGNNWNPSSTVVYMAFAENPFVTSTGIPTTAR